MIVEFSVLDTDLYSVDHIKTLLYWNNLKQMKTHAGLNTT